MTWWRRTPRAILLCASSAVVLVLVTVAIPGGGASPFVVRIAEFLLAGGAAYLLDDAAAPLTAVTPHSVWRRRSAIVLAGAGLLTATWLGILLVLRWQDALPPVLLATAEVVVLCLGSLAAAAVLVRRGDPEPGGQVAPVIGLLGIGALMADSLLGVALFVPWDAGEPALGVGLAWATGAVLAVAVIIGASRDPASRRWARPGRRTGSLWTSESDAI